MRRALWVGIAILGLLGSVDPPTELAAATAASSTVEIEAVQEAPTNIRSGAQTDVGSTIGERARSAVGLLVLLLIAWAFSMDRSNIRWRTVGWGIGLQLIFGILVLKTPFGAFAFDAVNTIVIELLDDMEQGARFVFGNLVYNNIPVGQGLSGNEVFEGEPGQVANAGAFFAFYVLSTIVFFSSLMTVLYHLGIMQVIVKGFAWVMQRTMGTSGAETLSAAGNIFVGQTEAPLLVKPFVEDMTNSEMMSVMTAGFATVAGAVLAAYVGMLVGVFPDIAGHLMAASVMSAPAAMVVAKLMVPETGTPVTAGTLDLQVERPDVNVIQAAARGASEGVRLAVNVGAMLLAFTALIYLVNGLLGWSTGLVGLEGITLERILGWVLAPLAWIIGVDWADAQVVGSLMGVKTVLNEFIAYLQLAGQMGGPDAISPRSLVITTYALSGFANFSSIAIQIGGIGGIAPTRLQDVSQLGMRAMIGGSIAGFMTAAIAGVLV